MIREPISAQLKPISLVSKKVFAFLFADTVTSKQYKIKIYKWTSCGRKPDNLCGTGDKSGSWGAQHTANLRFITSVKKIKRPPHQEVISRMPSSKIGDIQDIKHSVLHSFKKLKMIPDDKTCENMEPHQLQLIELTDWPNLIL